MIAADAFLEPAQERGFSFYAGVPCSFLTPLINRVISDPALNYVGAASEGEAVAVAAGAWLAGRRTVVMCQNSGLGNTVNPLTSLNHPFRIPTLLIVTWRGQPGLKDEPQHELMGEVTGSLLDTIAIGHAGFPKEVDAVAAALDRAERAMAADELPFALIMEKGSVRDDGLDQPDQPIHPQGEVADLRQGGKRPARIDLLRCVQALVPAAAAVVATTGKTGRELFTCEDRSQQLYQVGSMGCASAMGLGIALNTERPVLVLDGDGAALMKLGSPGDHRRPRAWQSDPCRARQRRARFDRRPGDRLAQCGFRCRRPGLRLSAQLSAATARQASPARWRPPSTKDRGRC